LTEGSLQYSLCGFGLIMIPRGNALCLVNGYEYVCGCTCIMVYLLQWLVVLILAVTRLRDHVFIYIHLNSPPSIFHGIMENQDWTHGLVDRESTGPIHESGLMDSTLKWTQTSNFTIFHIFQ